MCLPLYSSGCAGTERHWKTTLAPAVHVHGMHGSATLGRAAGVRSQCASSNGHDPGEVGHSPPRQRAAANPMKSSVTKRSAGRPIRASGSRPRPIRAARTARRNYACKVTIDGGYGLRKHQHALPRAARTGAWRGVAGRDATRRAGAAPAVGPADIGLTTARPHTRPHRPEK